MALMRTFLEQAPEINTFTLRFHDGEREGMFQRSYFRDNLSYIRLAHVLGIISWAAFALLARSVIDDRGEALDLAVRFGVAIPVVAVGLALSYTRSYERIWQWLVALLLFISALIWSLDYVALPSTSPRDLGFAGMMLILAFIYVLSRVQFVYATAIGALSIVVFDVSVLAFTDDTWSDIFFANYFMVALALICMAASYGLERFARLLFLRERELDAERGRADDLLANTLPLAIVERLKERGSTPQAEFIADGLDEVSVLFADMVGFTAHAERIGPAQLVALLDEVFTRFDEVAAHAGMEKIKTVGDAYMAVAGAPNPRADHADSAAEMALGVVECLRGTTWPTGAAVQVRVGIASGPVVAGVIGRQRFAYDLWGNTVNLASRLESAGQPGQVLVSQRTAELLTAAFEVGEPCTVELKGIGPTQAWFLRGRAS